LISFLESFNALKKTKPLVKSTYKKFNN